jgi:hypothetical protein
MEHHSGKPTVQVFLTCLCLVFAYVLSVVLSLVLFLVFVFFLFSVLCLVIFVFVFPWFPLRPCVVWVYLFHMILRFSIFVFCLFSILCLFSISLSYDLSLFAFFSRSRTRHSLELPKSKNCGPSWRTM